MRARLAFIAAHAAEHAIRLMCQVLGVARSWYHAWHRAAAERTERAARRDALTAEIREIFVTNKGRYGAPRVHAELLGRGRRTTRRTVAKLMRENGIRPQRGRRRAPITTDSRHSHAIAPNLLDRNFKVIKPDTVWLADISYVPTDEGWLYLAAVKDLATMEIVGWSMSDRLKSTLCLDALGMAIRSRRPPRGLIQHTDRGVQYACGDYRKLLGLHGVTASMSRKGNCLERAVESATGSSPMASAPMESFFSSLKTELVHRTRFRTRAEARAALFEYIEIFYNRQRRHSSIGYRTPAQARLDMSIAQAA
jgi:transposase InsO family protein